MNSLSYTELVDYVKARGTIRRPRGIETWEIQNVMLKIDGGVIIGRKGMNQRLALLESAMLLGGIFDLNLIKTTAPRANHSLYLKQSNYGPRVKTQLEQVVEALRDDLQTRRAMIYFNNRGQERDDLACTTSIQLFADEQYVLNATVTMRSWDLVYGLPMDLVMFSSVLMMVADALQLHTGALTINVGSLHIYGSTAHLGCEDSDQLTFGLTLPETSNVKDYIEAYAFNAYEIANSDQKFAPYTTYNGFYAVPSDPYKNFLITHF